MCVVVPLAGLVLARIFVVAGLAKLAELADLRQASAMGVVRHTWGQRAAGQPLALVTCPGSPERSGELHPGSW